MSAPNITTYEKVVRNLPMEFSLNDIEMEFIICTDMARPETIQRHISAMVKMGLINKVGHVSYTKKEDWEFVIAELKKKSG